MRFLFKYINLNNIFLNNIYAKYFIILLILLRVLLFVFQLKNKSMDHFFIIRTYFYQKTNA